MNGNNHNNSDLSHNEPPFRSVINVQWDAAHNVNKVTSYLSILIMSATIFVDERLRVGETKLDCLV